MRNYKDMETVEFMTSPGIVMYPWVFEKNPEEDDQGKTWFGVLLKFPKEQVDAGGEYADDFKDMRRQFMKAAKEGWPKGNDPDGGWTEDFASPLRDGDIFNKANNKKKNEELFGHYYISFKTKDQPGVVMVDKNGNLRDCLSKEDFYPGCIAVVSGVTFPYSNKGNEGVGVRLTNVCRTAVGERMGGKPSAKEQFKKFGKGAPSKNDADDDTDELL